MDTCSVEKKCQNDFHLPSEKESILKRKNLLLVGANSSF